jgi:hypothetical protein
MKKVISWKYWDGSGIFSSKNNKEEITLVYAEADVEKTIAELGYVPDFYFSITPGISFSKIKGYTRRASKFGNMISKYEKLYPDMQDKYPLKTPPNGMEYMDYIVAELPHLKNYVNPLADKYPEYIFNEKFTRKEAFYDENFVNDLLNYRPLSMMGGEIKDFQNKHIPNFIKSVKYVNPKLFEELLKYPKVQDMNTEITPVGKLAKVHTLDPGKIELVKNPLRWGEDIAEWDGKNIKISLTDKGVEYDGIKEIFFEPEENFVVKIFEETTFNDQTEIVPK